MRRFVKDDPGYLAWLAAHPDGFVLNTWAHVSSSYLVLHRAACRTINRPLAAGSHWTEPYAKTCSDDRRELEEWAVREAGAAAGPCGRCLRGQRGRSPHVKAPSPSGGGGRAPRLLEARVEMAGDPIRVVIPRAGSPSAPRLVIEGAQWLAETFFLRDPSAVGPGSYDTWIRETQADPARLDRLSDGDVTAVNSTMAARTSHKAWAPVIAADGAWLARLDPAWDLFETPEAVAEWHEMRAALHSAFVAIRRPGIGLAVATKVLHIKRPRLVPVLDRVVVEQVGARIGDELDSWLDAVAAVRETGRLNAEALRAIRAHLESSGIADRSLVRILDALLWVSSPGAGLFAQLEGWERVLRPRRDA